MWDFFAPNTESIAVGLPAWLDLLTVLVGSVAGTIVARERHLDLVGFIGLAILCGLGGGLIRDTIMQVGSVYLAESPYALITSVTVGVLSFLFSGLIIKAPNLFIWLDILSVAFFALSGTDKGIVYHMQPLPAIFMGAITGVGGGMLRDVFLGIVPKIFQRSNLYAFCAFAGSAFYWVAVVLIRMNKVYASIFCVFLTVSLRMWSLSFNIQTSVDVDLVPHTVGSFKKLYRKTTVVRNVTWKTDTNKLQTVEQSYRISQTTRKPKEAYTKASLNPPPATKTEDPDASAEAPKTHKSSF